MSRFNIKKAQSGFEGWSGEQKILAEQGEVFKTPDGQIQKISNNAPSHDDEMRINKFGINKVNKGDGGVEIDADSVLSDSYRQVENGNREHNVKEQIVKIKPIEGESIAGQLGLDIRLKKAVSPSQLFLEIQKVKDKQVLKILGKSKNFINNRESANSNNINRSQISALPTDEEIYDAVFDYVENKKDESGIDFNEEVQAQYGNNNSLLNSLNLIPKGQYSTSVQKPINPFQIQKNQRDIFEEEWKNRQTQLSPTKQTSPAVQQYYKNEQAKKEANDRINNRQNITNAVGMALAPVPVLGEIYNTANTIANGIVDVAQGEYADAATSLIPFKFSKKLNPNQDLITPSYGKKFTKNSVFDSDNFKSEIDWGKWNPDTPKYPKLINEYNTIEESTKKAGTWLKNPDGSFFQGTPEQFVQQQSSYFKKAFPDYYGEIVNHNSPNKFAEFKNNFFGTTSDRGWYGEGVYAHPNEKYTQEYGINNYKLYVNSKNKGFINKDNYNASKSYYRDYNRELKNLEKNKELKIKEIYENPKDYEDVEFWKNVIENQYNKNKKRLIEEQQEGLKHNINQYSTLTNPQNGEVVIPFNNPVKSAVGNVGFFDMTNPDIYKGIVPLSVAAGMSQQKHQYGGDSILSQLGLIEKLPKAQSGVTTNARDFLYTKEELSGNDYKINKRLEQCKTGNCLEETNLYFDKYVSPRLSIPNSNELKEKYNISSGRNHSRYNEYGESADSWDIHGLLKEKGHVNYTGEDVNKVDLNSLPIGTLLGYGEKLLGYGEKDTYNKKENLSNSRHSARVIGYDEEGIPIVYDYNKLLKIGDSGLGFKLNNITIPNEYKKYTRKYLADNNLLEEKITPLKINYKGKTNYDEDEFLPFKNNLERFKDEYMDVLGISNNSYDEFARQAVAMALAESRGGDDTIIRMKGIIPIPTYLTERFNPFAKTKGITQLNVDNLFKDERIAKKLKALNITEDNYDPYKSTHIVPATLLYLKYINSELDKNTTPLSRIEKVAYRNVAPKFFKKKPNEAKGDFKPVKNYKKEYDAIELK